jgi:hypothetical protein
MHMQPDAAHGESSPWFNGAGTAGDLGAAPEWLTLTPEALSAARKRLVDARAVHDHGAGVGCAALRSAYDLLARARAPMSLPDPLRTGDQPWNRP